MSKIYYLFFVIGLFFILLFNSLFVINEKEIAVIFRFGEAIRVIDQAGLNVKIPLIQTVVKFDKRILPVTVEEKELTAGDGKRMLADAFAKFRVVDAVRFFKTVHSYNGLIIRLNRILESSMRKVIGKVPLSDLLTDRRTKLMNDIEQLLRSEAKNFGVDVLDVRLLRTDLPPDNSAAIYRRMQTEREKEAKEIRAQGQEEADKIMSNADKNCKIILADAYASAQKIKGSGDAEAAKIYNDAYSIDKEFYNFYRTLQSYEKSFGQDGRNSFILSPDSNFLRYLELSNK